MAGLSCHLCGVVHPSFEECGCAASSMRADGREWTIAVHRACVGRGSAGSTIDPVEVDG